MALPDEDKPPDHRVTTTPKVDRIIRTLVRSDKTVTAPLYHTYRCQECGDRAVKVQASAGKREVRLKCHRCGFEETLTNGDLVHRYWGEMQDLHGDE